MFKNWALWIYIYVMCWNFLHVQFISFFVLLLFTFVFVFSEDFQCNASVSVIHSIVAACKKRAVLFIIGRIFICTDT